MSFHKRPHLIIVPSFSMGRSYDYNNLVFTWEAANSVIIQLTNLAHKNIRLFVDEFCYIPALNMKNILSFPWKSVTMLGSYKIN